MLFITKKKPQKINKCKSLSLTSDLCALLVKTFFRRLKDETFYAFFQFSAMFFLFISVLSLLLELPTTNHPLSYQRRHQMQQLDKGNKGKAFNRRDSGYSSNSSYIQRDARETYLQRKSSHV